MVTRHLLESTDEICAVYPFQESGARLRSTAGGFLLVLDVTLGEGVSTSESTARDELGARGSIHIHLVETGTGTTRLQIDSFYHKSRAFQFRHQCAT